MRNRHFPKKSDHLKVGIGGRIRYNQNGLDL